MDGAPGRGGRARQSRRVPPASVPTSLRGRAFRGSLAVRAGLLTPNQLRGPACRAGFRDVHVDATVPDSHAFRARVAARLLLPGAVVSGLSAAVLWGVDLADVRDDDVELVLPPGTHPRRIAGVRGRRVLLDAADVRTRAKVPVTSPTSTALRVAALLPPDDAVVAVDRLARAGVVDLDSLRAAADVPGRGSVRVRAACARADGLAESPQETRLRLLMCRGGLPAPVAQYVVRDGGGFVARVDFGWPEHRVAVEYDGVWHAEEGQFARDRRRLNRLQAAGWRVVFVTAADLRDPVRLVAAIASALGLTTPRAHKVR